MTQIFLSLVRCAEKSFKSLKSYLSVQFVGFVGFLPRQRHSKKFFILSDHRLNGLNGFGLRDVLSFHGFFLISRFFLTTNLTNLTNFCHAAVRCLAEIAERLPHGIRVIRAIRVQKEKSEICVRFIIRAILASLR